MREGERIGGRKSVTQKGQVWKFMEGRNVMGMIWYGYIILNLTIDLFFEQSRVGTLV